MKKLIFIGMAVTALVFAPALFAADEVEFSNDALQSSEVTVDSVSEADVVDELTLSTDAASQTADMAQLRNTDRAKYNQIIKDRQDYLKTLKLKDPEKFKEIAERLKKKRAAHLEQLKERNPERYQKIMEHRQEGRDRREDVRDVREDKRDTREDVKDAKEDVRDAREDVRDAQHEGGKRDKLEDIRDSREDVKDAREDVRDSREDVRDRKEDKKDQLNKKMPEKPQAKAKAVNAKPSVRSGRAAGKKR